MIDSLVDELRKPMADSARSLLLAELAYRYYNFPDSMYAIAKRGLSLATLINFEKGIAANRYSLSLYHEQTSDYSQAMDLMIKALLWQSKNGSGTQLARCYMAFGALLAKQNDIPGSITNMKKANDLFDANHDMDGWMLSTNNLGFLYMQRDMYDSSLIYFQRGIKAAKKMHSSYYLIGLTGSIAELHLKNGDVKQALRYIKESISLNENKDLRLQAINKNLLAKIYLGSSMRQEAKRAAHEATVLSKIVKAKVEEAESHYILFQIYETEKNYEKALHHFTLSAKIKDDVFSEEKTKERLFLLHQYERDSRDSYIKLLEKENRLRKINRLLDNEKISKQRWYLTGLATACILFIGLFISILQQTLSKRKYIRVLEGKNEEILAKSLQLETLNNNRINEMELKVLRSQLSPHFIFNSLNAIQAAIITGQNDKAVLYLGDFSLLLRKILNNSYLVFISLSEEVKTIQLYLRNEAIRFEKSFNWKIHLDEGLDANELEVPSMLIQPFLEKTIRGGIGSGGDDHLLSLSFSKIENRLMCRIEDNVKTPFNEIDTKIYEERSRVPSATLVEERILLLNSRYDLQIKVEFDMLFNKSSKEVEGKKIEISFNYDDS